MEAHRIAEKYGLIGPTMEQAQYNLFERNKIEADYSEIYKNVGLGTTIWSPLSSGLLTGKYNDGIPKNSRFAMPDMSSIKANVIQDDKIKKVKKLGELAAKMDVNIAALSIAWCIKNPNVTTAILGATKKQQLIENLSALEVLPLITADVLDKIEKIFQNKPTIL